MSSIVGQGGTTMYIRQNNGLIQYRPNEEYAWTTKNTPITVTNDTPTAGILTVEFVTNFTLASTTDYFICGSSHIQFGSRALREDGSRPVFTINGVNNYPGLIQNGTNDEAGKSNIHVYNLTVTVAESSSQLAEGGGWIGQSIFALETTHNYIINCSSDGPIPNNGGGIVGYAAGNGPGVCLTLIGCSSYGLIGQSAGGIAGSNASITCNSCWSEGVIGDAGGGIIGQNAINSVITNCYSTGDITGGSAGRGGICGRLCINTTITGCYSTGRIGSFSGGIVGDDSVDVTITNCYSLGDSGGSGSGGIIGPGGTRYTITHCYTVGRANEGYIIASSGDIPDSCYSEAGSMGGVPGSWISGHANTVLQGFPLPIVGTTWVGTGTNQAYELFNMGYTPYILENITLTLNEDEITYTPSLNRSASAVVKAGNSTEAAIVSDKAYTILDISGGVPASYSSIEIDSTTGVISTTAETAVGTYIINLRNIGSYNITQYQLTVPIQTISGAGGTIVYIQQEGDDFQYRNDNEEAWTSFAFPTTVVNTTPGAGILIVNFFSDFTFSSTDNYFICGSSNIQFGSTELNYDGSRPVITINGVPSYPGLIQNSQSNIYIYNLFVTTLNGSTLFSGMMGSGGWIGQEDYGIGAANNYIVNCSSDGPISSSGGGIVGSNAAAQPDASLTIIGCSSSGSIDVNGGGIAGIMAGFNGGSVTCNSCWSEGRIDTAGGGIIGANATNATITNCYSKGEISQSGGGICGRACGDGGGHVSITGCYSEGLIREYAGGIGGGDARNVSISNCYSLGNMTASTAGGIIGTTNSTAFAIANCYTVGTVVGDQGYIIGSSYVVPPYCYAEALEIPAGPWSSANTLNVLLGRPAPIIGTTWVETVTNQPYELFNMGYTPYDVQNIKIVDGDTPFLNRSKSALLTIDTSTDAALVSDKDYTILDISGGDPASHSSITIDLSSGVISITGPIVPGTYTIYLRNNGSYNITEYQLIIPITITGAGGTTIYIKQEGGIVQYSTDNQLSWTPLSTPAGIANSDTGNLLTVEFVTDISFPSVNDFFFCGSSHIQFGSASLKNDGSRPIITIDGVQDYQGLVQNGTESTDGKSNIYIYNLTVNAANSSLYGSGGGWIGQGHFGKVAANNYIVNCSSEGPIEGNGGGIVGAVAAYGAGANLTLIGCSSSGSIGLPGSLAGGIAGAAAGTDGGSITCESCWTTGTISSNSACGGILGSATSNATITNCYSTGDISGSGGGICGTNCGIYGPLTITNCYSRGALASGAGGIAGYQAVNISISNCYSVGSIAAGAGGIIGPGPTDCTITNCYTVGTVVDSNGYIIGGTADIPLTCFSEAGSIGGVAGTWNPVNASSALLPGTIWTATIVDEPYELTTMGYTPYTIANIDTGGSPSLKRIFAASFPAGSAAATPAAIVPGRSYTILRIADGDSNSYASIELDSDTGVISTTAATTPGIYTIYLRNTGSYNITLYELTITGGGGGGGPGGNAVPCCARTIYRKGPLIDNATLTALTAGNTYLGSVRQGPISYTQLMAMKKAKASKK